MPIGYELTDTDLINFISILILAEKLWVLCYP